MDRGVVPVPGDLRWAKLEGHPWWPGIICKSPQSLKYEKVTKAGVKQFHIHFFSNPPTRAWIKARNIRPFHGSDAAECHPGGTYHCTKSAFRSALKQADKAQFITLQERITFVTGQNEEDDGDSSGTGSDISDEVVELDEMVASPKKRKMSPGKGSSPKKRKIGPKSASETPELLRRYVVGGADIPEAWETTYVLMNTNDVPEDLSPTGSMIYGEKGESRKKKPEPKATSSMEPDDSLDLNEESEDVPRRKPGPKSKTKRYEDDDEEFVVRTSTSEPKKPGPKSKTMRKYENDADFSGRSSGKGKKKASPKGKAKVSTVTDGDKENRLSVEKVKKKGGGKPKAKAADKSPVKKKGKKQKVVEVDEEEEMDEEELIDSDDDPGYSPEEEKEESDADPEDDLSDSDADPDWGDAGAPKAKQPVKKGVTKKDLAGKKKTAASKKLTGIKEKSIEVTRKPATIKSTGSLKLYKPPDTVRKVTDTEDEEPAVNEPPIINTGASTANKNIVIKDSKATGPEPDPGEFLIEKSECKDGEIPFLWRYKKGGLVQKYEKLEEDGKTFYQNMLCFSDWWPCYAHKYQQVAARIMFKYRNKEKVMLTEQPNIEQDKSDKSKQSKDYSEKSASTAKSPSNAAKMQEQEISSTTPEHESTAESGFQIGKFVLDKTDEKHVDNFPIWKIESAILLKKYEAVIREGKLFHKPVKTYRGYRDIAKTYLVINTKKIPGPASEDLIEVNESSRPKLVVDINMEEEYDKNPMLHHFYVYLQVFLSQALEPGFMAEIKKTKDETYLFPLAEVDKIVSQKSTMIERKVRWTTKIKEALHRLPYLRTVQKVEDKRSCEAMTDTTDTVIETAFLFGAAYDDTTLQPVGTAQPSQEFRIGKTAVEHITVYHQLCHFRFNLYDKCLAKIKMVQERKEGDIDVTEVMDGCLGNKVWVLQNFEEFMKLVN